MLFAVQKGDEWYYIAADQAGTPCAVIDAAGEVVKLLEHDSFGNRGTDSNPAFDLTIGFAGGLADADTGLVRFGSRDYDPEAGRWTARDPVLFNGTYANLYSYARNNPVGLRDPSGLLCIGYSIYRRWGGGRICINEDGFSFCEEAGFGSGGGLDLDLFADELDRTRFVLRTEVGASAGPASAGVYGRLPIVDDCGTGVGVNCKIGPIDICGGGRVVPSSGDWSNALSIARDPGSVQEWPRNPELEIAAKIALVRCKAFRIW